jgi:hypothetical protein
MLVVKTVLLPDSFGGLGLFAAEHVPADGIIWVWHHAVDLSYAPDEVREMPEVFQAFLRKYGYRVEDGGIMLNGDDARFWNHSDTPNTFESPDAVIRAVRAITVGEELTCDYRLFDKGLSHCGSFLRDG